MELIGPMDAMGPGIGMNPPIDMSGLLGGPAVGGRIDPGIGIGPWDMGMDMGPPGGTIVLKGSEPGAEPGSILMKHGPEPGPGLRPGPDMKGLGPPGPDE